MISQLCVFVFFLLSPLQPAYGKNSPPILLAQTDDSDLIEDFDDSVLKDIEDVEIKDEDKENGKSGEKKDKKKDDEESEEEEEDEEWDEEDVEEEEEEAEEEEEEEIDEEWDEEEVEEEEEAEAEEEEEIDDEWDEEEVEEEEEAEAEEEEEIDDEWDEEEVEEEDKDPSLDLLPEEESKPDEEEVEPLPEEEGEALPDEEEVEPLPEEEEEPLPDEEMEPLPEGAEILEEEEEVEPLPEEEEEPLPDEEEVEPLPEEEEESLLDEEVEPSGDGALNIISNIQYLASENRIVIDSSEVISYQSHQNKENNQVIIEILQARLSKNLQWPYILKDHPTGFGMIQADQKDDNTVRIVIQVKEKHSLSEVVLSEKGNQMVVAFQGDSKGMFRAGEDTLGDILPARTLEDFYFGKLEFSGHPLSFHVIDAPVKQVLNFISEESGLNMVIDEKVTSTVTLKLENIPWDQAFHTILKVKDLGYTREGSVIMISTLDDLKAQAGKLKEVVESSKALAPFVTRVVPVSYGKLSDIVAKITPLLTKGSTSGGGKKGEVIVNKESGTLVVIDTERTVKKVEELVNFLDKPPRQVMIEARIVDAIETFTKDFGFNWNMTGNLPFSINARGLLDNFSVFMANTFGSIGGGFRVTEEGRQSTLRLTGLPLIGNLGASLRLAETKGYARVVSSPKVVTISGQSANITRNAPILIPKSVTRDTGNPNFESEALEPMDIQISLSVTPQVTPSGSVFMQVQITRSSPGPKAGERGQTTSVQRSAQTQVLVKNGHTVVIGGIYQYDENIDDGGVPFLRHIPFINFLFGNKGFRTAKSELLVFLTPKLIEIDN